MKVYNSFGREKQEFTPMKKGVVTMYTCGPTVYGLPHIGNYRSFFMADMITRYFKYKGYKVNFVMNITDIDDKTIRDSAKEGMALKDFTRKYEKVFLDGIDALNIQRATTYCRATEHIPEMISLIQELVDKGIAYVKKDGVYYSISKFKDYGNLSQVDLSGIKPNKCVMADEYDKENPQDFALWKSATKEELKRKTYFDSPWGKGRPGWHIECSAMSMKYLGHEFDIHTGGVDLLFPHHENEIAQSQGAGYRFARYWLHGEHLLAGNRKMAKSEGNFFTLTDLLKKYDVDSIRYLFLSTHYRDKLNYTEEAMQNARSSVRKLKSALATLKQTELGSKKDPKLEKYKEKFEAHMDDDFNTPLALRVVHDLAKYLVTNPTKKGLELLEKLLSCFGLFEEEEKLSKEIEQLIKEREKARKAKDWKKADDIREELKKKGIELDDTPSGTIWKKA